MSMHPSEWGEIDKIGEQYEDAFRRLELIDIARKQGSLTLYELHIGDFLAVDLLFGPAADKPVRSIVGRLIDQDNATFEVVLDTAAANSLTGLNINFGSRAEKQINPGDGYKHTWDNVLVPTRWATMDLTGSGFATGHKEFLDAQYAHIYINGVEVFPPEV